MPKLTTKESRNNDGEYHQSHNKKIACGGGIYNITHTNITITQQNSPQTCIYYGPNFLNTQYHQKVPNDMDRRDPSHILMT